MKVYIGYECPLCLRSLAIERDDMTFTLICTSCQFKITFFLMDFFGSEKKVPYKKIEILKKNNKKRKINIL